MKVSIGQDSHRIDNSHKEKKLLLGGIEFQEDYCLSANSDGDVVLHAITNAISGITCKNILGKVADDMCKNGITNSENKREVCGNNSYNRRRIDGIWKRKWS